MDLLEKIYNAGVVGVGGAGFPTHIKLKSKVEYYIINAAECEPLLEVDKYLMREKSDEIIEAIEDVAGIIGAEKLVIGLKSKYKEEIHSLQDSIKKLGSRVQLHLFDNFYPAGDEQVMVYEITKRVIPAGGIPLDIGAVVNNVGTMFNIYEAKHDKPVVDKYVTVIGEVHKPGLLRIPIGTRVSSCISKCGGSTYEDYSIVLGGPMMGKVISYQDAETTYITKTMGSLIILPPDHYLIQRKNLSVKSIVNQARTACIQCRMCTDLCPRNLIGHTLNPHKIMRAMGIGDNADTLKEALICSECGICETYACPMGLSPRLVNAYIKGELRQKGIRYDRKPLNHVNVMRDYRKVPVPRLISRLSLNKYKYAKLENMTNITEDMVYIPLSQHIGKPAVPVVAVGDRVSKGQLIGQIGRDDFGANIHASIDGIVTDIKEYIAIRKDNGVTK